MMRCCRCGLIRSDPVAPPELLARLYRESAVTYAAQTPNLRRTYARYLRTLGRAGSLLEIGCGNGFFLEEARGLGYDVWGVEPSEEARNSASAELRDRILAGVFREGLFAPSTFDVITAFQVLDHLPDPVAALTECRNLLKPRGLLLMLHHNAAAASAKLLRERSPIVDIEHTFLYTPRTVSSLLAKVKMDVVRIKSAMNWVSLQHLVAFLPFPAGLKASVSRLLSATRAASISLPLPLGNMLVVAQKDER